MIIHPPEVTVDAGRTLFSSRIEIETPGIEMPEKLWYRFDEKYRDSISLTGDALLASLLPVAMRLGEDVVVKSGVSQRLAYGLDEWQQVLNCWWPDYFHRIDVSIDRLEERHPEDTRGAVGCLFSGGVDSYYTLWRHLPENEPMGEFRVTHAVMINGFDKYVDLDESDFFRELRRAYSPMFERIGVEFLIVGTNLQEFRRPTFHKYLGGRAWASSLVAGPLVLGKLFSRLYLSAGADYSDAWYPHGSHPMTDYLISTETFETIHDGADRSRAEKTLAIAEWPEAYSGLHPCYRPPIFTDDSDIVENCCKCEKCLRTMILLELVGTLSRFAAFPRPLRRWMIAMPLAFTHPGLIHARENLEYARRIGRRDIAWRLRHAILTGRILRKISDLTGYTARKYADPEGSKKP
jgi:hypothetical protein